MTDERYVDDGVTRIIVRGLHAKAGVLEQAQRDLEPLIASRRQLADAALLTAYGPWAPEFRTREKRLLDEMVNAYFSLSYSESCCACWPEPSQWGGSGTSVGNAATNMSMLSQPAGSGPEAAGVNTTTLASYVEEAQRQHDEVIIHTLKQLNLDGISGVEWPYVLVANPPPDPNVTVNASPISTPDPSLFPYGATRRLAMGPMPMMPEGELNALLPFLRRPAINFIGMSSDVLTFAKEHLEAFNRPSSEPSPTSDPGPASAVPSGGNDRTDPPARRRRHLSPADELPEIPIAQALPLLVANIGRFDQPGSDGLPPDGRLTLEELKAAASDTSLPPDLRAIGALFAANEGLFAEIALLNGWTGMPPSITADDITTFLETAQILEVVLGQYGSFDPNGDGEVSLEEVVAGTADPRLTPEARQAAQYLERHPSVLARLSTYGEPAATADPSAERPDTTSFTRENLEPMVKDYRQLLGLPPLPTSLPTLPPSPPEAIPFDQPPPIDSFQVQPAPR